jgi:sugar phosphate permease
MGIGLITFGLFVDNLFMFIVTWTFMVSLGANIGGFAPNWTAINNWFVRKKGRAMGIGMASQAMGGVILAPVLAFIISRWGWETGAIVTGIAVFLLVIPISRIIRTRPQDMGLLPDGDQPETVSSGVSSENPASSAAAGIAETINFSIGQARRTSSFWVLMGALGLRQMGQAGMQLHMSPMLQERYGFGAVEAGLLIGLLAITGAVGGITIGIVGDHFPRRRVMGIVVGLEALSLLLVILGTFWFVYVFLVLFGFGQGVHALNRAMLGEYFGNSHYARLWGILSSATTPLAAAGPIYAGWTADNSGYGTVVFTFMFLYAFSAILYWNCRRPSLPTMPSQVEPALPGQPNAG